MSLGPCDTGLRSSGLRPSEVSLKPVLFGPPLKPVWGPFRTDPGPSETTFRALWDRFQVFLRPVQGPESESSLEHSKTRSRTLWDHESRALWYRSKVLRFRALWGLFKTSLVWTVSKTGMRPFRTDSGPLKIGPQTLGSSYKAPGPSETTFRALWNRFQVTSETSPLPRVLWVWEQSRALKNPVQGPLRPWV